MNRFRGLWIALAVAVASVVSVTHANAQTSCGQIYQVAQGDTLKSISKALYRSNVGFQLLLSANYSVLNKDGNLVDPGDRLVVPCLDGSTVVRQVAGEVILDFANAPAQAAEPQPAPSQPITTVSGGTAGAISDRVVLILAGDGFAPFTGKNLPGGGMLIELAEKAISKSKKFGSYRIDFIDDRATHLEPLLSNSVYDFSLAWTSPECIEWRELSENLKAICDGYAHSVSMFDETVQFYMRGDLSPVGSHADLVGMRLCEARGWGAEGALAHAGLRYGDFVATAPLSTREDCLRAVAAGLYDITVLPSKSADDLILANDLTGAFTVVDDLALTLGLSAVIGSDNPDRKELLSELNIGLFKIRLSGEWYEIVSRHLVSHKARLSKG